MSISSALYSAMSGLAAASRASEIVSGNIANAMTPGYSRRSLELVAQTWTGPGVRVAGVVRHVDPALISDRRSADASAGGAATLARFQTQMQRLFGTPGDGESLGAYLNRFDASLIEAAARPDSSQRLDTVVRNAAAYAGKFNAISAGIQDLRQTADAEIASEVSRLNTALGALQEVNVQISARFASGGENAALLDQRQGLIDTINQLVPVRVVQRDRGQIGLMTQDGTMLLDGVAAQLEFSPTNPITPHQTREAGHLSGLSSGTRELSPDSFAGGRLAALFDIRDDLAVTAQETLDTAAADLVQRFQDTSLDPTLSPGAPGLFTDAGDDFDAASLTGLAGRLALNSAVDPQSGGHSWRLRDGLGATEPGPEGDATLLLALGGALDDPRSVTSPGFSTGDLTAAQVTADLMSRAGLELSAAEERLTLASARQTELQRAELAMGVDTDAEMQTLMMVEKAYAANARVIETVDEMMNTLLRL